MKRFLGLLMTGAGIGALATPAMAQVEEIVVTAQKRSENLQKIPITVTAVTSELAEGAGVRTTQDLQMVVPGISVQRQSAAANIFIRGVGTTGGQAGQENAIAVFIDGVYQPSMNGALFSLNNVERVEVLKGPQGTLYGRNATGGAVNVITRKPSIDPEIIGEIGYGNLDTIDGTLYATTGLAEGVAADIAAYYYNQQDGFGRNIVTGNEVNKRRDFAIRSKLLMEIGDLTEITLSGSYAETKGSFGLSYRPAKSAIAVDLQPGFPHGFHDTRGNDDPASHTKQWSGAARVEHDLGGVDLVSITAYQDTQTSFAVDLDMTALPLAKVDNHQSSRTFTQELQIGSSANPNFKWIGGLYYFNDLSEYNPFKLSGLAFSPGTDLIYALDDQKTQSYAAYGQTTFTLVQDTNLTLGLRYTIDRRKHAATGALVVPGVGDVELFPPLKTAKTTRKLTWRIALDHAFTDDVLGYVSYNRGFKSGVYNLTAPADPVVDPEQLDAVEVGLKTSLFDNQLRLNTAGFYYSYKNLQLSKVTENGAALLNAAKAEIYGVDIDLEAAPTDALTIRAGLEYLHARYKKFRDAPYTFPSPTGGNTTIAGDASGNRLLRAPDLVLSLSTDYRIDLSGGSKVNLNVTYNYNDGFYWEPDNRLRQSSIHLLNLRAKWTSSEDSYSVTLWGRNVLNEKYYDQVGGTDFGDLVTVAPGRTYGVSLGFHF